MQDVLIIVEGAHKNDVTLFLQPDKNEQVLTLPANADLPDLAVFAGCFNSKSQARKNGWHGEIPDGLNIRKFGKTKRIVWFKAPANLPMPDG